ncbi:MAG: DNA polymerase III subunit [Candidatus Portnoybacteria bacterium]|nr:DNA polymerase III subunit [Candidatus Portnoybacteria bacterium]
MIIGHEKIWNFLKQSAARNRLAHAYFFVGPSEIGKKKVAIEFIKSLQCENSNEFNPCNCCRSCSQIEKGAHPDVLLAGVREIGDEEKKNSTEIKIEEARHIQHHLSLSTFSGKIKAVIIDSAENLNIEAANRLLKTIEEPSPKSILILISSEWQKIPLTILSRCQTIRFSSVKKELIESELKKYGLGKDREVKRASVCCCGRPGAAIKMVMGGQTQKRRESAIEELGKILKSDLAERFFYAVKLSKDSVFASEILDYWLIWYRDRILESLGLMDLEVFEKGEKNDYSLRRLCLSLKKIKETQELLKESGFNSRLIFENLMLAI